MTVRLISISLCILLVIQYGSGTDIEDSNSLSTAEETLKLSLENWPENISSDGRQLTSMLSSLLPSILRGTTAELKKCVTNLDNCRSQLTESSRSCKESLSICNANVTVTALSLQTTLKSRDKCVSDLNILNEKYSNVLGSECSCNFDQELLDVKEELDFCNIDLSEAYIQMSKLLKAFAPKIVDCHLSLLECNESVFSLYESNMKCLQNLKKCSTDEISADRLVTGKSEENNCAAELKECKDLLYSDDFRDSKDHQKECMSKITEHGIKNQMVRLATGVYYFSLEKKNWFGAQKYCNALGMKLIAFDTVEEQEEIYKHIEGIRLSSDIVFIQDIEYWLGLNDLEDKGQFEWDGGNEDLNKRTSELNMACDSSHIHPDEKCIAILMKEDANWKWKCQSCMEKMNFICEMSLPCSKYFK